MTVKERLLNNALINNGMFPTQAEAVFQSALSKLETSDYRVTWNRPASEYPDAMYAIWAMMLKPVALEWIDANCPAAWFRPIFTEETVDNSAPVLIEKMWETVDNSAPV